MQNPLSHRNRPMRCREPKTAKTSRRKFSALVLSAELPGRSHEVTTIRHSEAKAISG